MSDKNSDYNNRDRNTRKFSEDLEVAADRAADFAKTTLREGNSRRLIIRTKEDRLLVDTSLTIGVAVGALFVFMAMPLAVISAVAALVLQLRFEIVKEDAPVERITVKKPTASHTEEEAPRPARKKTRISVDEDQE